MKDARTALAALVSLGIAAGAGYAGLKAYRAAAAATKAVAPPEGTYDLSKLKPAQASIGGGSGIAPKADNDAKGSSTPAVVTASPVSEPKADPKPAPKAEPTAKAEPINGSAGSEVTMFGGTPGRNFVNAADKNVIAKPEQNGPEQLWTALLGSRAYGGPIVAGGKAFVGTNNEHPRNPRDTRKNADGEIEPLDKGVLMCFDIKSGDFL